MSDVARYFRADKWGGSESKSGRGSSLAYTANLREQLPAVLREYQVRRFLDAPCGDFNWMQAVDLGDTHYLGVDIVADLVTANQEKYGGDNREFRVGDITTMTLPDADMMMCRDCLFHLTYRNIKDFLDNFSQASIPFLLLTTHLLSNNRDIDRPGHFRQLNMCRPPFNFADPIVTIDDWIEGHPRRQMALWSRDQIVAAHAGFSPA